MEDQKKVDQSIYQKKQYIGSYQVLGPLDEGRFMNIYLGQNQDHRARIEILRPPLMGNLREDFLTQARALMTLEHPHILRMRDAGIDKDNAFLVTDYASYSTLRFLYPTGSVQPLSKILPALKQIAAALDEIHNHNLIHGNIQPETIFFDQKNNAQLWNFRIEAIELNREQLHYHKIEELRNAVAYTAPERIQGKPSAASDQYSLAIIIYELLCGAVPFTGSYIEVADQQLQAIPLLLRQKGIPSRIEQIVMKALSKQAEKRFATTQRFIQALETELLREQGLSVPPPPVPKPPLPPVKPVDISMHPSLQVPAQSADPAFSPQRMTVRPDVHPYQGAAPFSAPPPQGQAPGQAGSSPTPTRTQASGPATPTWHAEATSPAIKESALAPRRNESNKITRRAFAVGLVGVATIGGAGGWYLLSKKLTPPAVPVITPNEPPPATPATVNNQSALIFTGHLAAVNAVAWSPDGTRVASASDDTYVQIFEAATGKRDVIYTGHTKEVAAVAWSPDGHLIASGSQDGTVHVWNATNGKNILIYTGHTNRVNSVSWSSNSQALASGSEDKTVQIWNSTSGSLLFKLQGHTAGVLCVSWQPDNSSVASGSWDGTLRDWAAVQHGNHFAAGDQIFSYGGHGQDAVFSLAWSPDSRFVASAGADQTVQISNGADGTPRPGFFTDQRNLQQANPVRAVSWSPLDADIASGDTAGKVYVWHTTSRKTFFIYRGHKKAINAVAWSPNGKRIASASADATVHIWQPV